jgi:hypothetical protein
VRHLSYLREFKACWTQGLTDTGVSHLEACERIETVNVMGTPSGDGAIRALAGKPLLRFLNTGRGVSGDGLPRLHDIPAFRCVHAAEVVTGLMGAQSVPSALMIDGDFTDDGLRALEGLDGLASLQFFRHSTRFTAAGLEVLRRLPRLAVFGIDGRQCGDFALRQIAAIPGLRQLQAQGAVAGDAGWQALSRSATLEYLWGRECPNFGSTGFLALSKLPSLRGMGIGCASVDGRALAALPDFPALRQLVPIGMQDSGFQYIGRCSALESLYCMYCRDTGDSATAYLGQLDKLRMYYAGMTRITDRSLEMLGRLQSLEQLEFWQCMLLTDAGFASVASLPALQRVEVHGSPNVSPNITRLFRDAVRVQYSG